MKKPMATVKPARPPVLDTLFAAASTVVFLALMANVVAAVSLYIG